jgi:hypothetical protein
LEKEYQPVKTSVAEQTSYIFLEKMLYVDSSESITSAIMLPFLQQFKNPLFNRKPWDLINRSAKTLICQSLVSINYADTSDEINA